VQTAAKMQENAAKSDEKNFQKFNKNNV